MPAASSRATRSRRATWAPSLPAACIIFNETEPSVANAVRVDIEGPGGAVIATRSAGSAVPADRVVSPNGGETPEAAMTTKTARPKAPKKLEVDAEARALMANPVFRAMLDEAKASVVQGATISQEELEERLGPMTEAEKAHAAAYGEALDRLADEQGGEVTDGQGRLLEPVLTAAEYARDQGALAQLAEDSGCAAADIRAVAAALRASHPVRAVAAATR